LPVVVRPGALTVSKLTDIVEEVIVSVRFSIAEIAQRPANVFGTSERSGVRPPHSRDSLRGVFGNIA
jgi:hypothetical protein